MGRRRCNLSRGERERELTDDRSDSVGLLANWWCTCGSTDGSAICVGSCEDSYKILPLAPS